MTTIPTSLHWRPADSPRRPDRTLRLNPRTHGRGRVPGRRGASFDLEAFTDALGERDLDYLLSRYAPTAEIRIVDPDNPPAAPLLVHGTAAIRCWLWDSDAAHLSVEVTHTVDGGDRVAFAGRWYDRDGTAVLATSAAETADGLITLQHTILVWGDDPGPTDWVGPASRTFPATPADSDFVRDNRRSRLVTARSTGTTHQDS